MKKEAQEQAELERQEEEEAELRKQRHNEWVRASDNILRCYYAYYYYTVGPNCLELSIGEHFT